MSKRRKIHEYDGTYDIKYRGPLSYQHLRIAAWVLLALSQIPVMMKLSLYAYPDGSYYVEPAASILSVLGSLALPLLLMANFSIILCAKSGYKKLLIKFGALSGGVAALALLVYERYLVGVFAIGSSRETAKAALTSLLSKSGYLSFNLFLDLFLCTLVTCFLLYTPKKHFRGKKIILFRLFALLPILYEAVSVALKILASMERINLPPEVCPFLTTKPPVGFLVFVAFALFLKRRQRKFIKNGRTAEEYADFLSTNANSWHFSVHAAIILAVAAVLDFVILLIITVVISAPYVGTEHFETMVYYAAGLSSKWGFGTSAVYILIAPIMLLFSYSRAPKYPKLDLVIPIAGCVVIFFEYVELVYFALTNAS